MTPEAVGLGTVLAKSGLNVAAAMGAEQYDALVSAPWKTASLLPAATTVYVIGSGGSDFYHAALAACPDSDHPLDDYCEASMARLVSGLEARGVACRALFYWQRLGEHPDERGEFADFVAIARGAGLGASSRLGLLLHAHYGPWFAIRALLVSDQSSPALTSPDPGFDPCRGCEAPCISACHGDAVGHGVFAGHQCASTRHSDSRCASRCDARLACPVGEAHGYSPSVLAHHMTAHFRELP